MKFDVAVIADLCIDILFTGDVKPIYGQVEQFVNDYAVELGGSAGIFASQFSKLGGKVGLLGTVGNDLFGNYLINRIDELGISTKYISRSNEFKTSVGLGLANQDDRAMLTYKGSMNGVTTKNVMGSGLFNTTNHLHIASYFLLDQLQPFWFAQLSTLKQKGLTVSLDTNWSLNDRWQPVTEILEHIDVFIPNEEEALRIAGKTDIEDAGIWLSKFGGLVVVKRGENGAMVFQENSVKKYPVPEILRTDLKIADTTGAGDNFDAGFLRAWLQGTSLDKCVKLGMRCATSSLTKIGGIAGQFKY